MHVKLARMYFALLSMDLKLLDQDACHSLSPHIVEAVLFSARYSLYLKSLHGFVCFLETLHTTSFWETVLPLQVLAKWLPMKIKSLRI